MNRTAFRKFLIFSGIFLFGVLQFASDAFASPTEFFVDPRYDQFGRRSVEGSLRFVSNKALFYIEEDFFIRSAETYQKEIDRAIENLAREFDAKIVPKLEENFGSSGLPADGKLTVFLVRTKPDIGGYFDWRDLHPKTLYSFSNERPMAYLNVYRITHAAAPAYLAHEFQHLITYYQKDARKGLKEEVWLDELYSEYAPEFLGYNKEWDGSFIESRVYDFQQNLQTSLLGWSDSAANHGAAALFGRFLADKYGEKVISDAFHSSFTGIESIEFSLKKNGFSKKFWEIYNQWLIANYINNSINGNEGYAYAAPLAYDRFHVLPSVSYRAGLQETPHFVELDDWSASYLRITPVALGKSQTLKIGIEYQGSPRNLDVKIPYIVNYFSGSLQAGYVIMRGKNASLYINGFGDAVSSVILIPTSQYAKKEFKNDVSSRVSLRMNLAVLQPKTISEFADLIANQITALLAQIDYLRAFAKAESSFQYRFARDLYFGMVNDQDVRALQNALKGEQFYDGPVTGGFFSRTEAAVKKFQKKYGIEPASGYVGPLTRRKLNQLFAE